MHTASFKPCAVAKLMFHSFLSKWVPLYFTLKTTHFGLGLCNLLHSGNSVNVFPSNIFFFVVDSHLNLACLLRKIGPRDLLG